MLSLQHLEFFHRDHFEYAYHRKKARRSISRFIDFFWETDFDGLWEKYPSGFTDVLFPDAGYTYLINLGTPFRMQLDETVYKVTNDSFLPRYKYIAAKHVQGNKVFGIKFRVSPILFEKKVNFSEYNCQLFPLAYLLERKITNQVKAAHSFKERVDILSAYYQQLIDKYFGSLRPVEIVTDLLHDVYVHNQFTNSIAQLAKQYHISTRTLQRYFEATTGVGTKQAIQVLRIRKTISSYVNSPGKFNRGEFGYYDYSHFHKEISKYLRAHPVGQITSPAALLKSTKTTINY